MLRWVVSLLLAGVCIGVNYKVTQHVISDEDKESILDAGSDADAFDRFITLYDDIEPEDYQSSTDPVQLNKERARQKRIFVKNLAEIKKHNARYARREVSYKLVVNSFAVMDEANRRMYLGLGLNSTSGGLTAAPPGARYSSGGHDGVGLYNTTVGGLSGARRTRAATSLDWRTNLNAIKDQGTCGSCWTFPATCLIEYAYYKSTGTKLPLSEQELLSCVYESQNYNACGGGWYYQAWDWIIANNNHLASQRDYGYKNADGACYSTYYTNALTGKVKLDGYFKIGASDVVNQMQVQPLAVAFFVDNAFYSIGSGTFSGCYYKYASNHAVTLTGYGNGYWEIRNSWGANWGNQGYGRFQRSGTNSICNLLDDVYGIKWTDPNTDGETCEDRGDCTCEDRGDCTDPTDDCEDKNDNCGQWAGSNYCSSGEYVDWMKENCPKSCNQCEIEPRPGPTKEPSEECEGEDSSEYAASCAEWKGYGYCDAGHKYGEWMELNCAGTCCSDKITPVIECEDDNVGCPDWADAGYCKNPDYEDYMITNCQSSCDSCSDIEEETDEPEETEEPVTEEPQEKHLESSEVSQSSTTKKASASNAVDESNGSKSQTKCSKQDDAWFKYQLSEASRVTKVEILNGNFNNKRAKLDGASVYLEMEGGLKKKCGDITVIDSTSKSDQLYTIDCGGSMGTSVEIRQTQRWKKKSCLDLKDVKVYGFLGGGKEEGTEEPTSEEPTEDDNDGCPGGTVRCPDGICKHVHMC